MRELDGVAIEKVVFRVSAQGSFSLPLNAMQAKRFNSKANSDYLFYGFWIAVLVALGLYNAVIFFSLRSNVHLYYFFYVCAFGALLITASGIGQQYLWSTERGLTTHLANLFLALTNSGTALFVIHFLKLSAFSPALSQSLRAFSYFSLFSLPFVFIYGYAALAPILVSSAAIMLMGFWAALYCSLKGSPVGPFLVASLIVLLPCNSIGLLRFAGFFDDAAWTEHIAELGMAADALILSVALAFQVNVLRGDKEAASLARERERTAFAKRILQAKEQERRSIGKALHDSLGHKIFAI